MRKQKYRASVTIFAILAIMLVAQFLFTLLEGARRVEFEKSVQMNTDSVIESVFADYCSPLWKEYHLLGMTAANENGNFSLNNRSAQMIQLSHINMGKGKSLKDIDGIGLLRGKATDIEPLSYLLMTDGDGIVFERAVSSYMKQNFAYELAKGIYNNYESVKDSQDQFGGSENKISDALDALEEAKQESNAASSSGRARVRKRRGQAEAVQQADNPLTTVTEAQKQGVLKLVLSPESHLSNKSFSMGERVSERALEKGNAKLDEGADWYDKTLLTQYVCNYLSCYTIPNRNHALEYEMEYLVGGKNSDADNLRATIEKLLLIREGLNMASLMASTDKQGQAMALAVTLAGVSANPLIIEAVKYGLLASWAYVESVLDVRTLLEGGKIALIKSDALWTSSISNLPTLLSGWSKAKSCEAGGLNYVQYGAMLLLLENDRKLAKRMMDVEEETIRMQQGYETFQMDHVVCAMEIQATYEYCPLFMTFVSMITQLNDSFRLIDCTTYSYFEGKEGM